MVTTEELIEQYRIKHRDFPNYGAGKCWHPEAVDFFRSVGGVRGVLDFGCGKGGLVAVLKSVFPDSDGYDPAVPGYTLWPGIEFDGVCCLDVMEHLREEDVAPTLERIRDTARKAVLLNISTRPARHHLANGRNCHETVRDADWWFDLACALFTGWLVDVDDSRGDCVILRCVRECRFCTD